MLYANRLYVERVMHDLYHSDYGQLTGNYSGD